MRSTPSSVILAALAAATAIAIPAEGLYRTAYLDPVGILTVCYGSTKDITPGKEYSISECKTRLNADMLAAVEIVERCAPGLPVKPWAAFSEAVFNLGPTIVCNPSKSTAARLLAAGVIIKLPGLTKRRGAEKGSRI